MADLSKEILPFPAMEDFRHRNEEVAETEIIRVALGFRGVVEGILNYVREQHPSEFYVGDAIDQALFHLDDPDREGLTWLIDVNNNKTQGEGEWTPEQDVVMGGLCAIRISRYQAEGQPTIHAYELGSDETVRRFDNTTEQSRRDIAIDEVRELGTIPANSPERRQYIKRKIAEGNIRDQNRLAEREAGTNDQPITGVEMQGLTDFFYK